MTTEEREEIKNEMWQTVLRYIEKIPKERGSNRSAAQYEEYRDLIVLRCTYRVNRPDGSSTQYLITLRRDVRFEDVPDVQVEVSHDNHNGYWQQRLDEFDDRSVIVDHQHYRIAPETPRHRDDFRGHGGRRFVIKFLNGRTVETTNLWSQGTIPVAWRDRLPDNAVFVQPGGIQGFSTLGLEA